MIMRLSCLVGLLVLMCGCPQSPPPAPEAAAEPEAPPPPSWEEQVSALREGATTEIATRVPVSREQFEMLREGGEKLEVLKLVSTELTDEDLRLLNEFPLLRHVVLDVDIDDAGMEVLAASPTLEIVNLPSGKFTDAGLAAIVKLPLLTLLRFESENVTDAGIAHLTEASNLRFLHVMGAPISDDALDSVRQIPLLESFYIDGGNCTDTGFQCLLKSRPQIHIHVDQLHLPGQEHEHE